MVAALSGRLAHGRMDALLAAAEDTVGRVDFARFDAVKIQPRDLHGGLVLEVVHPAGEVDFDRAELERAIGDLDAGLQGIVGQGDAFALKLSTAQEWAKAVGKVRNAESHAVRERGTAKMRNGLIIATDHPQH